MFIDESVDKVKVVAILNQILEAELAGVVRYTHYSFMVYGYNRIPLVNWLKEQANESLLHAQQTGELISGLEGHPSLSIGKLLEHDKHDIEQILKESLEHEVGAMKLYRELLALVEEKSVLLEEFARSQIHAEEQHIFEVAKMLRVK